MEFFNDLYGVEEKSNKAALVFGAVMGSLSLLFILAIVSIDVDTVTNIIRWYFSTFFISISLFSFSSYFFSKKKNKENWKGVKYAALLCSLLVLAIVFLPITLTSFVTEKIKFYNFFPHSTKYIISIFIPMIVSSFAWAVSYICLSNISELNASTIAALLSFLLWRFGSWFILFLYHKLGKNHLSKEVYAAIKKDLYISIFAMITFFTIIANCINFIEPYSGMIKGVTSAFAIYIAFDRLFGKWDKANKELEKQIQ